MDSFVRKGGNLKLIFNLKKIKQLEKRKKEKNIIIKISIRPKCQKKT